MPNALVTGAAGFIGAHLCRVLVDRGFQVWGLDALMEGSDLANLEKLLDIGMSSNSSFHFDRIDLRDQWTLRNYLSYFYTSPVEYVFHLAAQTHVDRSIQDDSPFWSCNVDGTANLLRLLINYRPSIRVILNQVTDEVYGSLSLGHANVGDPFNPSSPYACSKASQFFVGEAFKHTFGLPIISTFPSNTFGPGQWPEKLIPKFILLLLHGQKVPLMRSTGNTRDWLTVDDHVEALIQIAQKGIPGRGYNITANDPRTNLEVTLALLKLLDCDESSIEIVEDRAAHDCRYAISSCETTALGWYPRQSFTSYLKHTVEWYIANQHRYTKWLYSSGLLPEASNSEDH